jgi:hypothetical protein
MELRTTHAGGACGKRESSRVHQCSSTHAQFTILMLSIYIYNWSSVGACGTRALQASDTILLQVADLAMMHLLEGLRQHPSMQAASLHLIECILVCRLLACIL